MELLEEHRCYEGRQQRWRHDSTTLNCSMTFSIFYSRSAIPRRRRLCTGSPA